jgi:hypothetical protein
MAEGDLGAGRKPVLLVVTTAGAWSGQWLVLRVVSRDANRRR